MIESTFNETFSSQWVDSNITDKANELVILRKIIPWNDIIQDIVPYYSPDSGAFGKSLRMMTAILIISSFRHLSDRSVIKQIQENRYLQYFCNIPDDQLSTFVEHTTIYHFRKRLGQKGIAMIEADIFNYLRLAEVIKGEESLMDSTVLESNIVYPNDVSLIHSAFKRFFQFARCNDIESWWDEQLIKEVWRQFNLDKKNDQSCPVVETIL